jgi:carnitine O-octanoyltransferase
MFTNTVSLRHVDQHVRNLFAYQDKLPPLPVPDIRDTLQKYMSTVEPICSEDELAEARQLCDDLIYSAEVRDFI